MRMMMMMVVVVTTTAIIDNCDGGDGNSAKGRDSAAALPPRLPARRALDFSHTPAHAPALQAVVYPSAKGSPDRRHRSAGSVR